MHISERRSTLGNEDCLEGKLPTLETNLRSRRIVIGPDSNELVKMVRTENRGVPCQVVEVVHDDGNEQIQHLNSVELG